MATCISTSDAEAMVTKPPGRDDYGQEAERTDVIEREIGSNMGFENGKKTFYSPNSYTVVTSGAASNGFRHARFTQPSGTNRIHNWVRIADPSEIFRSIAQFRVCGPTTATLVVRLQVRRIDYPINNSDCTFPVIDTWQRDLDLPAPRSGFWTAKEIETQIPANGNWFGVTTANWLGAMNNNWQGADLRIKVLIEDAGDNTVDLDYVGLWGE